jgi:hypothetical protein
VPRQLLHCKLCHCGYKKTLAWPGIAVLFAAPHLHLLHLLLCCICFSQVLQVHLAHQVGEVCSTASKLQAAYTVACKYEISRCRLRLYRSIVYSGCALHHTICPSAAANCAVRSCPSKASSTKCMCSVFSSGENIKPDWMCCWPLQLAVQCTSLLLYTCAAAHTSAQHKTVQHATLSANLAAAAAAAYDAAAAHRGGMTGSAAAAAPASAASHFPWWVAQSRWPAGEAGCSSCR